MEWSISMTNGGKVLDFPVSTGVAGIYSEDGRYFLAILSHQIRVYFISTRQCTRTVDLDLSDCVDAKLDPSNSSNLIVYKTNEILKVNWKERLVNPVVSFGPVTEAISVVINQFEDGGLLFVSGEKNINVTYRSPEGVISRIYETSGVIKYAKSLNNEYLAILNENKEVISISLARFLVDPPASDVNDLEVAIKTFNYKSPIISIAVNNDNIIALGSVAGPIQIIFNDDNDNEKILRWHIGPAKTLHFHENFLLSGGDEKVLVIWQIDNDKTQFLPRLNGVIDKISVDVNKPDNYNLALNINGQYELLVLSAVDLVSRLSVNSIRPNLKRKLNIKNSTSIVEANPKTNHLYLPSGSFIQAFDLVKNEQLFHQTVSSVVPTGKVKSELKLMDPAVSQLKFSSDGEWMCTLDIVNNNEIENLLSQDDKNYALKFWKPASASGWELVTKIIDPHLKVQVLSVMPYQNGFITADASANLRFWKLRNKSWAVVKTLDLMKPESKSVDLAISEDNSVIVVSHDNVVYMVNSNFKLVQPLSLVESHIRSIELVGTDLIILSKTKLVSFNLVTFEFNSLMAQVAVAQGKTYLCTNNQLVALALNIQDSERCKVMLFKPNDLHPVFATIHSTYVNSIIPYNDGFLFVDNELRSGIISTNQLRLKSDESEINGTSITAAAANSSVPADEIENFSFKTFDLNSFNNIFETDNLDTLFDKIIKIVK